MTEIGQGWFDIGDLTKDNIKPPKTYIRKTRKIFVHQKHFEVGRG